MGLRKQTGTCFITNITRGRLPRLPFLDIKEAILGTKYELSIVFTGDTLSRSLNKRYRKKNKPANVLSFPLQRHEGEIYINTTRARYEARREDGGYENRILHLFIHGLFHLKGYAHSSTMERAESRVRDKFFIKA